MSISSTTPQEHLIQSAFELIVKAFDEQSSETSKTIAELTNKVQSLTKENQQLREESKFFQNENQQLRLINKKLKIALDSTRSKLDIIKMSVMDDNSNQKQQPFNTKKKNNTNITQSDYYINTVSTDIKFEGDDEIISGNNGIGDESDNDLIFINKSNNKISNSVPNLSKIKIDKNYIDKLKGNHRNRNFSFNTSPENDINNTQGNNERISTTDNVNNFLLKCKEGLNPQIFEKMLLLFNNHKSGLISSCDLISRVRDILQNDTGLLVMFNNLLSIHK